MLDNHFGPEEAARYDEDSEAMFSPQILAPTLDRLEELAAGGPALEFAIGTGRVALPLAARGVSVSGIELSSAMLDQLRRKPGGKALRVVIGDMATATVPGQFSLVYLVFNTLVNLCSQEAQVACFANAAAHLDPGGRFVVEVGVPQLRRLPPGDDALVFAHGTDRWGIDVYGVAEQSLVSHHFVRTADGIRHSPIPFRYVWPSELDLMARLAGLRLVSRSADWQDSPFTSDSRSHVSVWEKPAA